MAKADDHADGYGHGWDYRVVSRRDTNPDAPTRDQRHLAIHQVHYHHRDYKNHVAGDVWVYDHEPATVDGNSVPELLATLERVQRAVDRPAVIAAEHPTTTTHSLVLDDDLPRVSVRPDASFGEHLVEVQLEARLVHGLSLQQARELVVLLQAAIAELDHVGTPTGRLSRC
jgi:hypothetical protein